MTIDFTTEDGRVSDRWTPIATRFCGGSIDPQSVQIPDISSAGIKDASALTASSAQTVYFLSGFP